MTYDVSNLKLGKLAPEFPDGLKPLAAYADPFPVPPVGVSFPPAVWNMDGNDRLGDCTIAGVDHLIAAWNVELAEKDKRPSLKVLEAEYLKLSPNDQGCVESQVLSIWQTTGLFGHKIKAYAPLDHKNDTELKQGVAFLGGVYLGIECPDSAQQQFSEQEQTGQLVPWTVVHGAQIEGGHCIVAVGYNADGLYCVTWGSIVLVTWAFLAKYCEEAWAIISNELVEKGIDQLNINIAALEADLAKLS